MKTALGLMSGTSLDGIDLAVVETDGTRIGAIGPAATWPYEAAFRARLAAAQGRLTGHRELADGLARRHAEAIQVFAEQHGVTVQNIDVIGFHGQTVLHAPARRLTVQIGNARLLADLVGVDVVADFRQADVAAGGQGAPLAPLYHAVRAQDLPRPLAVVNIGGVANVTWLGPDDRVIAFDTGPGNALIDDFVHARTGQPLDRAGALAAKGRVEPALVEAWLGRPFFALGPPKSLDRAAFAGIETAALSDADGAATLTAFTARTIALARAHFPDPPLRWLVTGGGRHNRTLMAMLAAAVEGPVEPVEVVGWRGDALEAEAFAVLAVRSLRGLPLTLPETTGVARPLTGGRLYRPG